jgi:hypothetical protein
MSEKAVVFVVCKPTDNEFQCDLEEITDWRTGATSTKKITVREIEAPTWSNVEIKLKDGKTYISTYGRTPEEALDVLKKNPEDFVFHHEEALEVSLENGKRLYITRWSPYED